MADIFISYASDDRSRTEPLAKALEEQGWSVWWDRTIPPGKTFDQVIEEAINAARCVIVLWSEKSIKSDWVKEEANIGKQRNILVPAIIDPIDLPIGFGRIQAADLINWESEKRHPGFISLLNAISEVAGGPPERGKNIEVAQLPDLNLEKQLEARSKNGETFQSDSRYLKPLEKKPPRKNLKASHKKQLAFGIGSTALILILSIIGWFFYSNPELYTINTSFNPNEGSLSPIGPVSVNHGGSKAFTITPNPGYRLADLKVDGKPVKVDGKSGEEKSSYTFNDVKNDHKIEARFAKKIYVINTSSESNGSISPTGRVSVNHGGSKSFTIRPNPDYRIADVKVDNRSVGAVSSYSFDNVTKDHTISVSFVLILPYENEKVVFDPQAKNIVIPNEKKLNTDQITIEGWFKSYTFGETQWVVFKPPNVINKQPYYQYALGFRKDKKGIYFPLAIDKKRYFIDEAFKNELKINEWHHVAATYDGNWMRLYLDGKKWDDNKNIVGTISGYHTNLGIGGLVEPNKNILSKDFLKGELAEVRIWKIARTAEQIRAAMYNTIRNDEKGLLWSSSK